MGCLSSNSGDSNLDLNRQETEIPHKILDTKAPSEVVEKSEAKPKKANFINAIIFELNLIRSNPQSFASELDHIKNKLVINPDKPEEYILTEDGVQLAIPNADALFKTCKSTLSALSPMPALEYEPNLSFPFPDDLKKFANKEYLRSMLTDRENNNSSQKPQDFHYDAGSHVKSPYLLALNQLVRSDLMEGRLTRNVLNEEFTKIGVNYKSTKTKGYIYFTFA